MSAPVCRICLLPDNAGTKTEDALVVFHSVLCENSIEEIPFLRFCQICEHQLRKFYNFRLKCRRANEVLKTWKQSNIQEKLENLYKLIPPSNISFQNKAASNLIEFTHTDIPPTETIIKIEREDAESKLENPIIIEQLKLDTQETDYPKENVEIDLKLENIYYESIFNDFDDEDYKPLKEKTKRKKPTDRKTRSQLKAETRLDSKLDVKEKVTTRRKKFSKNQVKLKDRILELIDRGEFEDLGSSVKINREMFLKMFDKCDKSGLRSTMVPLAPGSSEERQRLKKFLLNLIKKNNPEYEEIFDVELLDTDDKKLAEFNRRKLSKEYQDAEFRCERCYKVFDVQRLLDYHNRWHEPSTGEHECDICCMRFATRKALAQHHKTNHRAVYRCKLCPLLTYNDQSMINHYNQHKGMEYSCPICLSVFSNKSTLNNHRLQAHKTSHICPFCARCFVSEKGLYFHKRLKHKDEITSTCKSTSVSCDKCSAVLSSPEVLLTHVRQMHSAQTIHKCFHCKEIFSSLEELKKHKVELDHQRPPKPLPHPNSNDGVIENGDEKPTCEQCEKTFNSRKSYLRHVNITHKLNRVHKCGFCQAKFTSADELDSHRTTYNHHRKTRYVRKQRKKGTVKRLRCNDPKRPFEKCELCSEMISTARTNTMYQHFQAMHPDTPYAAVYAQPSSRHLCDTCGKTFKDLRFFLDHANLHSGARPYLCTLCPRRYSSARHLKLHSERHGPPRHQCKDCGKMFNSAGNLFAHRRGHVGDRRFKCEICAKGFLHQAALNEHVRGVHNHIRRARKCRDK